MADVIYRVLTVYDADAKGAKEEVGSLAVVMDHALNLIERAKDLIGHVISLGSEAENTQIALAGLFSAGDFPGSKNFQTSMAMSSEIMKQMRKDARDLPGEFEDLKNIFQFGVLGGSQAGKSVSDIESMSARLMAVTKALGMSSEIAGREFSELMEGRASSRIPLFAKLKNLMGDKDMNAEKFNALSAPEKWERIQKALASFGPMINEYSHTWDAISSTSIDYLKTILRVGSSDVFGALKTDLEELNHWYETNQTSIEAVARAIFNGLGNAIDVVGGMIRAVVETVLDWARALGFTDNATENIETMGTVVGGAIVIFGAIKAATMAWEAAQWALNLAMTANPLGLIIAAVAALAAGIVLLIAELDNLRDSWTIMANDPALRAVADKAGFGAFMGEANPEEAQRARERMARREVDHMALYGSTGVTGDIKALLDKAGLYAGAPAMAHGNINNPNTLLSMIPGMGLFAQKGPDVQGLLRASKTAAAVHPQINVTQHITQTVYEAEDGQRVLQMTKKLMEESLKLPVQSATALVVGY